MALHACTQPNKPVARLRGSTLGPATGQHQAHRRVSLALIWPRTGHPHSTAAAGHSGLNPLFLGRARCSAQGANHCSATRGALSTSPGHTSSINSQVPTSFRTAVRLPMNDLSCTFFCACPPLPNPPPQPCSAQVIIFSTDFAGRTTVLPLHCLRGTALLVCPAFQLKHSCVFCKPLLKPPPAFSLHCTARHSTAR